MRCKNLEEYGTRKLSICLISKCERDTSTRNANENSSIPEIFIEFVSSGSPSQQCYQSSSKVALTGAGITRDLAPNRMEKRLTALEASQCSSCQHR